MTRLEAEHFGIGGAGVFEESIGEHEEDVAGLHLEDSEWAVGLAGDDSEREAVAAEPFDFAGGGVEEKRLARGRRR